MHGDHRFFEETSENMYQCGPIMVAWRDLLSDAELALPADHQMTYADLSVRLEQSLFAVWRSGDISVLVTEFCSESPESH
jgi:hypothetical protein